MLLVNGVESGDDSLNRVEGLSVCLEDGVEVRLVIIERGARGGRRGHGGSHQTILTQLHPEERVLVPVEHSQLASHPFLLHLVPHRDKEDRLVDLFMFFYMNHFSYRGNVTLEKSFT